MKIGIYVSSFPVLSETFVLNQITGLIDLGHEVTIVTWRLSGENVIHNDVERYGLMSKVQLIGDSYHHMPRSIFKRIVKAICLFSVPGKVRRATLMRCLNPKSFGKDAISLNLFFRTYYECLYRSNIQIAHCHFGQNGEKLAMTKFVSGLNASLVTVFHGHDLSRDLLTGKRNIYKYLKLNGDLLLPVSYAWKNTLEKMGFDKERIRVHHMGVSIPEYEKKYSSETVKILTVARLVEKKGISYAIQAVKLLIDEGIQIKYEIVGDGPLRQKLENEASKSKLDGIIEFTGPVSSDVILKKMQSSDVFLLPSVTAVDGDKEGVPVVLMEAMSNQLACVSSHHSGIPELIVDGVSGMLAAEKDVVALASKLKLLVNDQERRQSIGCAAKKFIEEEFEIRKLNQKLECNFNELRSGSN